MILDAWPWHAVLDAAHVCRCKDMGAWAKQAESVAQTALQTGTAVEEFYHAIGILATLHARKVISADLNTKQVRSEV